MTTASILLAAGLGTRMHSRLPKMLHPLLGRPMVLYAFETSRKFSDLLPVVVVGHEAEKVRGMLSSAAGGDVSFAEQPEQLGTGHAVLCAQSLLQGQADRVLITLADMPLLRFETLQALIALHEKSGAVLTMSSVIGEVPRGFGRVLRDGAGKVSAIVEEALATPEQLALREYNISAYCVEADWMWAALKQIKPSPKGEYYLTDLVALAAAQEKAVACLVLEDPSEGLGINTRVDLADVEAALKARINTAWMLAGVTLLDPATTTIEPGVTIGEDTVLFPGTHLRGDTHIGRECQIGPDTTLRDTHVGDHSKIEYSVTESATIGDYVSMGPFCHLRAGAILGDHVHLGNFGEVKDSSLEEGVKMGHFSYIGDAHIGANVNIGAGTITCNYDGKKKNRTEIGENTFIGSDTMLVAPIKIGRNAKTGAGSVVTHDVPDDGLVYGVPAIPHERKD